MLGEKLQKESAKMFIYMNVSNRNFKKFDKCLKLVVQKEGWNKKKILVPY